MTVRSNERSEQNHGTSSSRGHLESFLLSFVAFILVSISLCASLPLCYRRPPLPYNAAAYMFTLLNFVPVICQVVHSMYPIIMCHLSQLFYLLLQGSYIFGALLSLPAGCRPHKVSHTLSLVLYSEQPNLDLKVVLFFHVSCVVFSPPTSITPAVLPLYRPIP